MLRLVARRRWNLQVQWESSATEARLALVQRHPAETVAWIEATRYAPNGRWHVGALQSYRERQGIGTWLTSALWRCLGRQPMTVVPIHRGRVFWPKYVNRYPGRIDLLASDEVPDGVAWER